MRQIRWRGSARATRTCSLFALLLGQVPHQSSELAQLVAERFDLPMQLVQFSSAFGLLLFLSDFGVAGQFVVVAFTFTVAPSFGALAARRRGTKQPTGPAAAEFMPHRDVNHDRTMMRAHTKMSGSAGTVVRPMLCRMMRGVAAGVFVTAVVFAMFAVVFAMFAMVLAVSFAPTLAMAFAAVSIAMVFVPAMRVAMTSLATVMLAITVLAATIAMFRVPMAAMPGFVASFAAAFVSPFALATLTALFVIIVIFIIIFVVIVMAAIAIVVAQREQIQIEIARLVFDREAGVSRRDFADQCAIDGQLEMVQQIGRGDGSTGFALVGHESGRQFGGGCFSPAAGAAHEGEGGQSRKDQTHVQSPLRNSDIAP